MFTMILLAAFVQPEVQPMPKHSAGLPPEQAVASIDSKGTLAIARVQPMCGYGMGDHEVWLKAPEKKPGEKMSVKAKVTQMMVTVIELPAHVVEAHTVDGKLIPPAKLSELLAKERTVLIAMDGKKVDSFYLQLYKEGTIVLVPPASLGQLNRGPYGVIPEPQPIERPPEKRPPVDKDFDKGKTTALPANTLFISQPDEKEKRPEAPPRNDIGGILRVRDKLPKNNPPTASIVTLQGDEITMTRQLIEYVPERMVSKAQVTEYVTEQYTVKVGDRLEVRTRAIPVVRWVDRQVTVNRAVVRSVTLKVNANSIKAFAVTNDGKLESLATAKLRDMLAEPTPALIGDADLDPRHLELIRPGTLFLATPPDDNRPLPMPKEPIQPKKEAGRNKDAYRSADELPVSVAQDKTVAGDQIKELKEKRLVLLVKIHQLAVKGYQQGDPKVTYAQVHQALADVLVARLDLAEKKADSIKICEEAVRNAEAWEKMVEKFVAVGHESSSRSLQAEAYVLETRITLEKAKAAK